MKDSALYVHIPFCDHKCIYCDFYSVITTDNVLKYQEAILREASHYASEFAEGRSYNSIFFGGGTPSLMAPGYIGKIISSLRKYYDVPDDAEITLETNPGTVDKDKIKEFRGAGINRISIGIQSFNDDELKFLTRIHDKELAIRTINDAKDSGFENISIDLIFNLPGQTLKQWMNNLETAVKLPVKHISAYSLILEKGTVLNKMVIDGEITLQDSDYDAEIYEMTIDFLRTQGFVQYEVSNYAMPGYQCRHNNAYWHYNDYLSFGASAHSFVNGKRWWNISNLTQYLNRINECNQAVLNSEILTEAQMLSEYVMLALRSDGLNVGNLKEKFGESWINRNMNKLHSYEHRGLLYFENDCFILTPKGYALCDEILEKLL